MEANVSLYLIYFNSNFPTKTIDEQFPKEDFAEGEILQYGEQ